MNELVGKKIICLRINEDQSVLAFETDMGVVAYYAYGDCCSESWFADIAGVSALIGGIVNSVEEVGMNEYNINDGRCRQEEDSAYGYKITTDKGYADIVFRNSSNGYYGGYLELLTTELPNGMTEIADDWQA